MNNNIIPVTIITGFLGAGKTTLLNEILAKHEKTEFLIIENEAGDINIDRELVQKKSANKVFELTSGCICCSLSTELGTLLNSIIVSQTQYDHIIIEATGMADPGEVINMFSGSRVEKYFKLDGVICVVDAVSFLNRVTNFYEINRQISDSNIVLINKSDLIADEQMASIEEQILNINPFAKLAKTTYGKTKELELLNGEYFKPAKVEKNIIDFTNLTFANPKKEHAHQIQTFSYIIPGDFSMDMVSSWFEDYLLKNSNYILRIKGILSIGDMKHKIIIQSAGNNFQVSQGTNWKEDESRESKIVFIGTGLKESEIKEGLYAQLK